MSLGHRYGSTIFFTFVSILSSCEVEASDRGEAVRLPAVSFHREQSDVLQYLDMVVDHHLVLPHLLGDPALGDPRVLLDDCRRGNESNRDLLWNQSVLFIFFTLEPARIFVVFYPYRDDIIFFHYDSI